VEVYLCPLAITIAVACNRCFWRSRHLSEVIVLNNRSGAVVPPGAASKTSQKLLGLEIVRFVAALAVLFWHYQNLWWTPAGLGDFVRSEQPLFRYCRFLYEYGLYGVQVFWTISGYIFFWKYRAAVADHRVGGKTFFVLRFSRLYPLHFATLVLVTMLQAVYVSMSGVPFVYGHDNLYHFILQLLFASNWGLQDGSSFNGPIWSISIEVLVYVAFFVVLRRLGASVLLNVAMIVGGAIAYLLLHHNPIFQCVVCFYVGGTGAILAATSIVRTHRGLFLSLALAVLLALPAGAMMLSPAHLKDVIQPLVIACMPILLYVMAEHVRIPSSLEGPVQVLGNMTYSSYLIHFPLQLSIAIVCTLLGMAIPRLDIIFFLGYMTTVLVLATLIYRYFEMPCQRFLRRRFAPARSGT